MTNRSGELVAGRYRLLERIGSGGFGNVWRAIDGSLGVEVALKEVRLPDNLPEDLRHQMAVRALREARHAARLRGVPHVVAIHDVLESAQGPWIVMQLVSGRSLAQELNRHGPLDPAYVAGLARAMVQALAAAHAEGIIHRDVKPANVLLADDGSILLADFGIAIDHRETKLTGSGMVIGTVGYIAPEVMRGAPGDSRSDLYALGVTLYEAVEGVAPYEANTARIRPPRRAGALAPLLAALLRDDPAKRPTATQALDQLNGSDAAPTLEREISVPPPAKPDEARSITMLPARQRFMTACLGAGCAVPVGFVFGFIIGFARYPKPVVSLGTFALGGGNSLGTGDVSSPWGNGMLGAGLLVIILMVVLAVAGAIAGPSFEPDVISADSTGLTITRRPLVRRTTFMLPWAVIDDIQLRLDTHDGRAGSILVRFKPGCEPQQQWLTDQHIAPSRGGTYRIYRAGEFLPGFHPRELHRFLSTNSRGLYSAPKSRVVSGW
ncbi:serine/threonine-protein kinase [Kitasatospora sp. NPDC018058]|uniref:serine/threonine-protein kinase n=1 Tax=Kitasatospora sp. NPDC018058 TaxID=3364025 RepID=UPI0037BED4E7